MMKDFKLLEHTLIPLALFTINLSTVHLIYLLFMQRLFIYSILLVALCTFGLFAGILKKNKFVVVPAVLLYLVVLICSLGS